MDYFLLGWLVLIPIFVLAQIYMLGRKMSEPEKMIKPIAIGLTPFQKQTIQQYQVWLNQVGLEYCATFQFGIIQAVVFQQKNKPRYLTMMFHNKLTFSAESYLEDLTILDTSSSGSIGLFPRPGAYAQSFPGIAPQQLWQRHLEGEAHLTTKFGYVWVPLTRPYMDVLLDAMRLRMKYNRLQFLWPVRVLYRYAVTRNTLKGRTIAQQFP